MSAGLYELNGIISYSLNLEKKLKRKPNAKIIKVVENATEEDLIALIKTTEKVSTDDNITLYYFYNPETQHTISSIYQEVPEGYKKLNIKPGDKFAYKRINNTLYITINNGEWRSAESYEQGIATWYNTI
jgi:hypothetical protein